MAALIYGLVMADKDLSDRTEDTEELIPYMSESGEDARCEELH